MDDVLRHTKNQLAASNIDNAALDARLIVEHFSGTTRADALLHPDRAIGAEAVVAIESALARRIAGEPVHRILGFREFYGLNLSLSPETLEPRPDTETLVDAVLPFVREISAKAGECRILDLGTGTGAIALALLANAPLATAIGVDVSGGALATAAGNAAELGLSARFVAVKSDWFSEISDRYHVIASNPPYIRSNDIVTLHAEVRDFDPPRALDGGRDGLDVYRIIAEGAEAQLEPGGIVAVEIGATQKEEVSAIFAEAGFALIEARRDLGGNERALLFRETVEMPGKSRKDATK